MHPHMAEYLADILKPALEVIPIFVTTHSPYLLNHLPPESLIIVTKEKGATRAGRVRKDRALLKEALEELGLGEIYHGGYFGSAP